MTGQPQRPETRPVPLGEAIGADPARSIGADPATPITGVSLDSRSVRPGDLYVALRGARAHGAAFAAQALQRGAAAILTDAEGAALLGEVGVPVVVVADPRATMAGAAARVHGDPSRRMTMFGITGTNGKTTTAFLLAHALRATGRRVGTIGTIGFRVDDEPVAATTTTVTTPESPDLQALLAEMAARGADAVAMEVSSHAMAMRRADAIAFDVAGFANLGRDHLDFHGTMEAYFDAKAALFTAEHARAAVVNADDPWGVRLLERVRAAGELPVTTFGWEHPADVRVAAATPRADGRQDVTLELPDGPLDLVLGLPGEHNVRNAALALAMLRVAGVDPRAASAGLADVGVPGRLQRIDLGAGAPRAYVDFAHTPDAVAAAVRAFAGARAQGARLVVVVGCGGDRDPSKRGPMGAAAARGSDLVVVTDDNPRSEDPAAIRAQALAGAREAGGAEAVDGGDRRSAIAAGLRAAGPDGIVLVLGKGHEQGQDIGGTITPFDDSTVVAQEWARAADDRSTEGTTPWNR